MYGIYNDEKPSNCQNMKSGCYNRKMNLERRTRQQKMSEAQYQIQNYEEIIRQEESNNDVKLLLIQNS